MRFLRKYISGDADFDLKDSLRKAGVPFSPLEDACKACEAPCDDLGEYPTLWIDNMSNMLGRVKPYGRQVIVSTGQTNWAKEVTDVSGTLAYFLAEAHDTLSSGSRGGGDGGAGRPSSESSSNWPGFYDSKASSGLMILNGSHRTASEDSTHNTVIVLPDYTFVNDVPESFDGATDLWKSSLDPTLARGGKVLESFRGGSELKSWALPYNIVILICSHKRRDARCGVTAPILEQAIITTLNSRSWEVHTEVELDAISPSLQSIPSTSSDPDERDEAVLSYIRNAPEGNRTKRALLLKVSHVGGHKFAGNMVLYTPSGAGMWYGRVTPKEVPAIVDETIINGRIIPELLRAAVNVSTKGGKCFHDW